MAYLALILFPQLTDWRNDLPIRNPHSDSGYTRSASCCSRTSLTRAMIKRKIHLQLSYFPRYFGGRSLVTIATLRSPFYMVITLVLADLYDHIRWYVTSFTAGRVMVQAISFTTDKGISEFLGGWDRTQIIHALKVFQSSGSQTFQKLCTVDHLKSFLCTLDS